MKKSIIPILFLAAALHGAEWYVDNIKGDDKNPGTKEQPFRTFKTSLENLKGGDTLHLVPNSEPYTELFGELTKKHSGTPENPTVVDGHDAQLTRLTHFPAEKWTAEDDNIYSLRFPNNVVSMSGQGYYSGFPFVFVDGQPLPCMKKREDLTPGSCLLVLSFNVQLKKPDPLHKMLYVRLPEGKTPANVKIEMPQPNNVTVGGDYITVKNMTAVWNSADSFDTHRGKGIVFENIRAANCMDQCISSHSSHGVDVRFSHFSNAIDGAILDITFRDGEKCNVRYYGCVIEKNIRMGGAGFQGTGEGYVMESCIIRDNDNVGVFARGKAHLKLKNCVIVKGSGKAPRGVSSWADAVVDMEDCTVIGFENAVISGGGTAKVNAVNCKFIDCQKGFEQFIQGTGSTLDPQWTLEQLKEHLR